MFVPIVLHKAFFNNVFLLLALLAVTAIAQGRQTNSVTRFESLEYSLRANPEVVHKDSATEASGTECYRVTFVFSVKNSGDNPYKATVPRSDAFDLVVYRSNGTASEIIWKSTGDKKSGEAAGPLEIGPGETLEERFTWVFTPSDSKEGAYRAEATFLPTQVKRTAEFKLPPPPFYSEIMFTGKLLGYYRLPDRQPVTHDASDLPCPSTDEESASRDARVFINFRRDHSEAVLLGMGENFAPNYYSRVFDPKPDGGAALYQKELYSFDWFDRGTEKPQWRPYQTVPHNQYSKYKDWLAEVRAGRGMIPTDNVACFLSRVHYTAVVPGKHDFYYGPERLRELARFLATIDQASFQPVPMLATNLVIKTEWVADHSPRPDSAKRPLEFVTSYQPDPNHQDYSLDIQDFTDGGYVYPWLRFVRVNAKGWRPYENNEQDRKGNVLVFLCRASATDPDYFLEEKEHCIHEVRLHVHPDATAFAGANASSASSSGPQETQIVYDMYDVPEEQRIVPGGNYAICVLDPALVEEGVNKHEDQEHMGAGHRSRTLSSKPYCRRFSVYAPFFQYPDWPKEGYSNIHRSYKNPKLYAIGGQKGGTPVAVFGVVEPQLREHVGGNNFAWKNVYYHAEPAGYSESGDLVRPNDDIDPYQPDKRFKTEIATVDPVLALLQLEDFFEADYKKNRGEEFRGLRVLLAQMPPEQAKELAEHLPKCLRFDLVISAADDGLTTPNQIVAIHPAGLAGNSETVCKAQVGASGVKLKGDGDLNAGLVKPPTFVAVPPTHETQPKGASNRLLHIRDLRLSTDSASTWTYELSGDPMSIAVPKPTAQDATAFWVAAYCRVYSGDDAKRCRADSASHEVVNRDHQMIRDAVAEWKDTEKNAAIQQLTLWAIRKKWHADLALLQVRDFYTNGISDYLSESCRERPSASGVPLACEPGTSVPLDIQQILDRVVWKGDFIHVLSVKGSVLKSVLKQSSDFARIEKTAFLPVSESNRPLVTLGVKKDDASGEYVVDGLALDPDRLYSVATSDYIALGDTGYADLAIPPVGNPPVATSSSERLTWVSSEVCRDLELAKVGDLSSQLHLKCNAPLLSGGYYDELADRKPNDPRPGNTPWHQLVAWSPFHLPFGQPSPRRAPGSRPNDIGTVSEVKAQEGKNWTWAFDKMSLGFSGLSHSYSEQGLSQRFGGVQNAQVNAKHFHSWDWDANSKFTDFGPRLDWFTGGDLQYSSNFISQITGPHAETQSRNMFAYDTGLYAHTSRHNELPQLSLVLDGHFETQVFNPITTVKINPFPSNSNPNPLSFGQGWTRLLLGRNGMRWQNRKSYVEGGLEEGATLNAIQRFDITPSAGVPSVPCALEATLSLTNCINTYNKNNPTTPITSTSQVSVRRQLQERYGAYWNIGLTVPLHPSVSYNFQETSDYFFLTSGDNSADTRFRHQLVNTIKFYVFPNLSFEPTYSLFLYENKVDYQSLVQQQFTVKINYSFAWSNHHEWKQDFTYKQPSPQQ